MLKVETKTDPSPLTPLVVAACKWTVRWLPNWVTPNRITVFSLAPTVAGGVCLYLAGLNPVWFIPAVAFAFFHWYTDNLDGVVARVRGLTSDRGFFLDFTLDAVGYSAVFLGIAFARYSHFALFACYLILVLLRELVMLQEVLLRRVFAIPFPGPSEIPFAMALLCALTAFGPARVFVIGSYSIGWFDLTASVLGLGAVIDLIVAIIRLQSQLPGPRPAA